MNPAIAPAKSAPGLAGRVRRIHNLGIKAVKMSGLATGLRSKAWVLTVSVRLWLRARLGRPGKGDALRIQLNVSPGSYEVVDGSDVTVIVSTFLEGEYDIDLASTPSTILDLGSHAGATVIYFRHRYPSARIIGVEPSPQTFRRLRHNTAGLTDIELVEGAVVASDGPLHIAEGRMSTSSMVADHTVPNTVRVDGISLNTIRAQHELPRIDLLKVDIEGSEWAVFRGPEDVEGIDAIVGELHTDPGRDADAFFSRFPEFSATVLSSHEHAEIFLLARNPAGSPDPQAGS